MQVGIILLQFCKVKQIHLLYLWQQNQLTGLSEKICSMKNLVLFSFGLITLLFTGCTQTRYITEKYIKTNIEKHMEGDFSTIKTYAIFKGTSQSGGSYLELTGYKYANTKGLVLGADKYYMARQKYKGDQTVIAEITYINLNMAQCRDIITNYKILMERIKTEKPKLGEDIYHDFTVSKDLFISYKKSPGGSAVNYIDFWIAGERYRVSTKTIISNLKKFVDY